MAYVGSAKQMRSRLQSHFYDLSGGKHHNVSLQREYKIYGIKCYKISHFNAPIEESRVQEAVGVLYYKKRGLSHNATKPKAKKAKDAISRSHLSHILNTKVYVGGVL